MIQPQTGQNFLSADYADYTDLKQGFGVLAAAPPALLHPKNYLRNLHNLRTKLRWIFLACSALAVAFIQLARAHVPVPESVLDPQTAPEAWNVLRLATDNVARLLREDRLEEIPNQIALCSPALRALARLRPDAPMVVAGAVRGAATVNSAAQCALVGDRPGAEIALNALRAALTGMASSFDEKTVRADIYHCPMHPEVVSPDPAAPCPKCGMALNPRRIPYSFVYIPAGEPSILLTATPDQPLAAGRETRVTVRLSHRDGSPVLHSDLETVHTQPIHLLIVDPATREDYHHEHPVPTAVPGEYAFTFTPARSVVYRVFADLVPVANGVQEYPFTDLFPGEGGGKSTPSPPRPTSLSTETAGFRFRLNFDDPGDQPLPARQTHRLRVTVTEPGGQPVSRLEPVMNAFAHLVGFYDDGTTVVHLHPLGGDILNAALRGGPVMEFKFYPPKPGRVRLYCQVSVDGRMVFAPFDVVVVP